MKYLLSIAGVLATVLLLAGCRDTGYDVRPVPTFSVTQADVSFPASGGEGSIAIDLLKSGTPKITVDKDWCTARLSNAADTRSSYNTGDRIIITVEPNTESYSRETTLTIKMNGYTRTFGIRQGGIHYYFPDVDFGQLGFRKDDELRIPITIEGPMKFDVFQCSDWVTASVEGDEVVVKALRNNEFAPKVGFVTLIAGVQKKTVNFTQTEYPLSYEAFLGDWIFSSYASYPLGDYNETPVNFAVEQDGVSYKMTGLPYPIIMQYNAGRLEFANFQNVGTYYDAAANPPVTRNVSLRMMSTTGTTSTTQSYYFYTTYEVVNAKLILTLHTNHTSGTQYIGFAFSPGTGLTPLSRYYPDIKIRKL